MESEVNGRGFHYASGHGDMEVKCLECGDLISYGRTDKKFCCESCKNRYNNRKGRDSRIVKLRILNALEKNHRLLSQLLKAGVSAMEVSSLRQLGFDFDHFTSYRKFRGHAEMWCFDIRLTLTDTWVKSISKVSSPV